MPKLFGTSVSSVQSMFGTKYLSFQVDVSTPQCSHEGPHIRGLKLDITCEDHLKNRKWLISLVRSSKGPIQWIYPLIYTGWWFQTFFIFPYTGTSNPN